jgi:hypothetical protein
MDDARDGRTVGFPKLRRAPLALAVTLAISALLLCAPVGAASSRRWPAGRTVASGTLSDGSTWYLDAGNEPGCFVIVMSVGMGNGVSGGCGLKKGAYRVSTVWTSSGASAAGVLVVTAPARTRSVRVALPEHGESVTRTVRTPRRAVGDVVVFVSEMHHNTKTEAIAVRGSA